ncbi:proto-oncogene Mas-like [Anolis carolinensis]
MLYTDAYPTINGSTGIRPSIDISNLNGKMINIVIVLVCLLGILGNGRVIWVLGFSIKRNSFTTYVMNLSIADFGVLTCLLGIASIQFVLNSSSGILAIFLYISITTELLFLTFFSSQFLLTVISIDRCVAVFFPIWHRCHRPPYLSTVVCAIVWVVSFLLSGIRFTLIYIFCSRHIIFVLEVIGLLCPPLMIISTLTLFIKVCCKLKQYQQGKLVTTVLLTLLCFLMLIVPDIIYKLDPNFHVALLSWIAIACASVNSSINPLIYFLVGRRQKKGRAKVSMKVALERVFKDEQDVVEEETPMEEIHV